jgi:predicted kinase
MPARTSDKSFIVIVSGPPCTGKSTLAERLAGDLGLPFFSKDRIKEPLFDALGWSDRAWSRRLGAAALDILFMLAETELTAHRSFLLEGNFRPAQANAQFRRLMDKYRFDAFQVECYAETGVLLSRFRDRAASGLRHPGHGDYVVYPEVVDDLHNGAYGRLEAAGTFFLLDTTDFTRLDYARLLENIQSTIKGG